LADFSAMNLRLTLQNQAVTFAANSKNIDEQGRNSTAAFLLNEYPPQTKEFRP
jgi:hypothetical protein